MDTYNYIDGSKQGTDFYISHLLIDGFSLTFSLDKNFLICLEYSKQTDVDEFFEGEIVSDSAADCVSQLYYRVFQDCGEYHG
nr:MAG TPA: hypothetical protein [Caudoviricetes sp.]